MAITKVTSGGLSDIAAAVEGASDSNKFTDADHTKLNAIEASATADQTKSDIEGLGIDVPAANLTGTVATAKLADDAVTNAKIADDAVDSAQIADGAVDNVHLATGIASSKLTGALPAIDGSSLTGITTDTTTIENNIALLGFYRASDHSKAKYNLVDQVIDDYNDATGIDAANSTNEVLSSGSYYGGSDSNPSGGTETSYSSGGTTYNVSTFTANGNYIVPAGASSIQALLVGGGGAAGAGTYGVGGGGGGAVLHRTGYSPGAATYAVVVGTGGDGNNTHNGGDGTATTFNSFSATGGGGGGGDNRVGNTGANAGGSGYLCAGGTGSAPTASGWSVYAGYNGGSGFNGAAHGGGGGGGATAAGQNGTGSDGGDGGNGKQISIANTNYYWGAGGGGGVQVTGTAGNGGLGGGGGGAGHAGGGTAGTGGGSALNTGGNGTSMNGNGAGGDAGANTGSGGGAEMGDGANGIAIFVSAYSTPTTGADLTLQSVATTAESAPTTADIVMLIEDASGTATINTDIKAYISRNGSAFSSAVTLTDEGNWGTNKRILAAHDVDISGITSGTSMKYKITTHNQSSGSKETKIHATSLAWA